MVVIRESVKPDAVQAMARAIIDDADLSELQIGGIIRDVNVTFPAFREGAADTNMLYGLIFNSLHEYYITTYGIRENDVRQLLTNSQLNSFIGGIASEGIAFLMTGNNHNTPIVSSEAIVSLVQNNAAEIERITNFPFNSNPQYSAILRQTLQNSGIDDITWGSATSDFESVGSIRTAFNTIERFSLLTLIVAIVLTVLCAAALVFMNRRRIINTFVYFGIPAMVSGGLAMLVSVLASLLLGLAVTEIGIATTRATEQAMGRAISDVTNTLLFTGLALFGTGLVMIVAKVVIGTVNNRRGDIEAA
jgi:hypothetical protein